MMLKRQKTLRGWEKLVTFLSQKTLKRVSSYNKDNVKKIFFGKTLLLCLSLHLGIPLYCLFHQEGLDKTYYIFLSSICSCVVESL